MPTTIERITLTLTWAVTVTGTSVIAIASSLPSAAVIAVVEVGWPASSSPALWRVGVAVRTS